MRVANREFVGVAEMQTTLVGLGLREGRVAIVVGWRSSEVPLEVALEEIENVAPRTEEEVEEVPPPSAAAPAKQRSEGEGSKEAAVKEDTEMGEAAAVVEGAVVEAPVLQGDENAPASGELEKPTVSVYRPSDSQTLAAAQSKFPHAPFLAGICG